MNALVIRTRLIGFAVALWFGLCLGSALAHDGQMSIPMSHSAMPLGPGDFGYRHHELHKYYQRIGDEHIAPLSPRQDVQKKELGPGDRGFEYQQHLPGYQQFFTAGKCHCATGECRPTYARPTETGADSGYDMLIDGKWCPVPKSSQILKKDVPKALWAEEAHVCASATKLANGCPMVIECSIVNEQY